MSEIRDESDAPGGVCIPDQTPAQRLLARALEFPQSAALKPDELSRRDFMALLGASVALAGLGACVREPGEKILPYVHGSDDVLPGTPLHFATCMTLDGYATGLLVTSHEGRPTKIEGNPDHPASLGAAGVYEQASVLQLYDPHRARTVRAGRRASSWEALAGAFSPAVLRARAGTRGAGLALLLEPTTSSVVAELLARVRNQFPDAHIFAHAALTSTGAADGARIAFGEPLLAQHDFARADVVVSFGSDFASSGPFHLRYARQLGARRRDASRAHRLFVAESAPTPTGILSDQRVPASPSQLCTMAIALLDAVSSHSQSDAPAIAPRSHGESSAELREDCRAWLTSAAAALIAAGPRSAVIAGEHESAELHAVAHALNAALGNVGTVVTYTRCPIMNSADSASDLAALRGALRGGGIDTFVILGGNPVYAAPADLDLGRAVRSVRNTLYCGMYDDETAAVCTWFGPTSHYLESWGDARAYDGTASFIQPLVSPLHDTRTVAGILTLLSGSNAVSDHDMVRDTWRQRTNGAANFDLFWQSSLALGRVPGTALPNSAAALDADAIVRILRSRAPETGAETGSVVIRFTPDPAVRDGAFADNAWLQELPDPITKLTWDNALLLSPTTARSLAVDAGDEVAISLHGRELTVPILVVRGHADNTASLSLGYGRRGAEAVARGVGANANLIRTWAAPFADGEAKLARTGRNRLLAVTQDHWALQGRAAEILGASAGKAVTRPDTGPEPLAMRRRPLTLYEPAQPAADGFGADQWAMVIDLDSCTGCGACVVACQAENNIPVVGREGVLRSREMQWMRIDRYVDGPPEAPVISVQPMLCQHCEKAPCEYVCPVDATVHSDDGLNEMVYNRCVGTRFCSNNCPYKVRRFNWFDYNGEISETERMARNPEVSIRARGVMEKCTFCVQRIRQAQLDAQLAGAERTGPVVTACAQTCPTGAIVFGSLTAPASEVARLRSDPRCYTALDSLGTVPRVRYLGRRDREERHAASDVRPPGRDDA